MEFGQLRQSFSRALEQMRDATIINEKVLSDCLHDISRALLQADVNSKTVDDMVANINRVVNLSASLNKRRAIEKAIFDELCEILDPGKPSFTPQKGETSVIMFVGLPNSGRTTTCIKYAFHHQKKGWKPAIVCGDSLKAGSVDHLKECATEAKIPFHASYTGCESLRNVVEGVERFKKEKRDLIIVDAGGQHELESALFEEMCQMSEALKPNLVIFVVDSSIGQAAFDQAHAFRRSSSAGAVIMTRIDRHAKGVGTLNALAATKSPVIFFGTGIYIHQLEVFDVKPFVRWFSGMVNIMKPVPFCKLSESLVKRIERSYTPRCVYKACQDMLRQGMFDKNHKTFLQRFEPAALPAASMTEDFRKQTKAKFKRYMAIMDSMTEEELDSRIPKLMNVRRMTTIATRSGEPLVDIIEMFKDMKCFSHGKAVIECIARQEHVAGDPGRTTAHVLTW